MGFPIFHKGSFGGGGGASSLSDLLVDDFFIPSNGQTAFALSDSYTPGGAAWFFVNGVEYDMATHFMIAGATAMWLDVPFTLENTDRVHIVYAKA